MKFDNTDKGLCLIHESLDALTAIELGNIMKKTQNDFEVRFEESFFSGIQNRIVFDQRQKLLSAEGPFSAILMIGKCSETESVSSFVFSSFLEKSQRLQFTNCF